VKTGAIPVQGGVLYRFVHEIALHDVVVYPSKPNRMVNLGTVQSEYAFEPSKDAVYPHRRKVKWLKAIPRANFSQSALHEIGSAITLFLVTTHAEEFLAALEGKSTRAGCRRSHS
jgi:restriction system protein